LPGRGAYGLSTVMLDAEAKSENRTNPAPASSFRSMGLIGESGFIEVDGARIHYEVEGDGHPLLLVHGGLGSLRMWDEQVPAFAERYRVIRYDTRGFGRTETDDVEFTNVADVGAVLDHVGAASVCLVGQSRGGMIALDFLLEHPERVDAFVSVASGVGGYEPQLPDGSELPPWDRLKLVPRVCSNASPVVQSPVRSANATFRPARRSLEGLPWSSGSATSATGGATTPP
jgi:pimeloyl-ACP methyl ester carboxylesterase